MLQIKNVPEDVQAAIKIRAAQAGMSVSDYLLDLIREIAMRPTMTEIAARDKALAKTGGGATRDDVKGAIRSIRDW